MNITGNTQSPIEPLPDLLTKPPDIIGYCFGFSCPDHHIGGTFDSITVDRYGEQKVCQRCGAISTPEIVKRTAEAQWVDVSHESELAWLRYYDYSERKPEFAWKQQYYMNLDKIWTKHEFVRFLNDSKVEEK